MKKSHFLRTISNADGKLLCFHSLYGAGNLQFIFDPHYIKTLSSLETPRAIYSTDDKNIIDDLVSARFLINDEVSRSDEREEYDKSINKWNESIVDGKKISYLNLSVAEICNFGCPHCSRASVNLSKRLLKKLPKIMTWEVAKKAIDFYFTFCFPKNENANIHFGSDEPLLNWNIVKKSIQYIRQINPGATISINTNLSLLTKEIALFFANNKINIITSLDGIQDVNDKVRIYKNGKGTFSKF